MVAVKERLKNAARRVVKDLKMNETGRAKNLNIFVESGLKDNGVAQNCNKAKPITHKNRAPLDAYASKSCIKDSENNGKKLEYGAKKSVGRTVLADIGNVKANDLESKKGKSSLPHRKDAPCRSNTGSTSQHSRMKLVSTRAANLTRASDDGQNLKMSFIEKNIRAASQGPITTKLRSHTSKTSRKSLPILKQEVENSLKSDSDKRKNGFPVKHSVRRSIVQKSSNLSKGNRVSDGFVLMASKAQGKTYSGSFSKKFVKPTGKTIVSAHRRSSVNSSLKKKDFSCRPDDASKIKQAGEKDAELKIIISGESHADSAKEVDIPDGKPFQRISDRRNSFTCSLIMSIPKLLKESNDSTPSSSLPHIYDVNNHLEVSDYIDDIYQYYWIMEGQNPLRKNYMEFQMEITPQMRGILVNWLIEVHLKFNLMEETLFLSILLLDRYLSLESIKKDEMQLVGLTVFLLASKYEDFWHPRVADLISISAESCNRDQMLEMEKKILKTLKFRLNEPTPYVFMLRFLKAAQSQMKKFEYLAFYILELCLVEYEVVNYRPSMLCASAIYIARCTMKMTPIWNPVLAKHTRYEESQIRGCVEMVLKFHKAAKTNRLKVAYEKYMKPDFGMVAAIKPLDRLPAL